MYFDCDNVRDAVTGQPVILHNCLLLHGHFGNNTAAL